MTVTIALPRNDADLEAIKTLFREYAGSLKFSLGYQDFESEMAGFPGKYGPPEGALLLARVDGASAGAVALRKMAPGICEMKRLYVRPAFKGQSLGRKLAQALVAEARGRGYAKMRLDTVADQMQAAVGLYRSMGFIDIPAYYDSPIPGTAYMELDLGR
jgi:ribosomal protein S18 acetylase RimI-like enzyme